MFNNLVLQIEKGNEIMLRLLLFIFMLNGALSFAQEDPQKAQLLAAEKAKNYVYEGNEQLSKDNFVSAEMEYRKAISQQPTNVVGAYNLGNSYYQEGNFEEALYRHQQALKNATTKAEKHAAYHNIGNILMQEKKCPEATEAFKNALKNNPADDETRYNYALAKECAEQQQQNQDNQDNQDQQDQQDKQDENQDDKKDQGDQNKDDQDQKDQNEKQDEGQQDKEGDQKEDKKDNQEDSKKEQDQGDKKDQKEQPKQQPGQLSPQQVKNLLEAMNAQEQKVQEKMNAEKQKGIKIQTEKDW
ncbi:MAG TPA: tetratricopeptide repeat protein [Flavobacteriaceae bacterium]|nr:tetratricopeptide repeat protein [Flavobacteriaceae bacterium]